MKKYYIIIILWIILRLFSYYYIPLLLAIPCWIIIGSILFLIVFYQSYKLYREKSNRRAIKTLITVALFLLSTIDTHNIIEKLDFYILENRREQIIDEVKQGIRIPDIKGSHYLGYKFPIVTNNDNTISIIKRDNFTTIGFWIMGGIVDQPQTYFIYTDDPDNIEHYEKFIKENPDRANWKIKSNWYRITTSYFPLIELK